MVADGEPDRPADDAVEGLIRKISHLLDAEDWTRLEKYCRQYLSLRPDDVLGNQAFALALMKLDRIDEMAYPVRRLLEIAPDAGPSHEMAARYWINRKEFRYSWWHARQLMSIDPRDATGYWLAGVCLVCLEKSGKGLVLLRHARTLEPDNAAIAEIELGMRTRIERSAAARAEQHGELKQAL